MGATRDVALTDLPFRGIVINTHTAAATSIDVEASDSGVLFINKFSTGGTTTYVLPSLAEGTGKVFWFLNGQSTRHIAVTAPSDCMMGSGSTYTTLTTSSSSGDNGFCVCDGDNYYFFALSGTWGGT